MGLLRDFTRVFLLATITILLLNVIIFFMLRTTLMAVFFLLILSAPVSIMICEYRRRKTEKANLLDMLRQILVSMYGISFTFWIFDVGITYYVLDVLSVNIEVNPLGWPLGALGVLLFYIPAMIFTYLLLFKIEKIYAILVAMIITVLTLYLGFQNFIAGGQNLSFIDPSVSSVSEVYRYLFVAVLACNITYVLAFSWVNLRETSKTSAT